MLTKSKRHLSNQTKIGSILKRKSMETYTQYIELINDYLNNTLSKEQRIAFESKLQNDTEFNVIYEDHVIFLNGISRIAIKDDIQKAKRSYTTEKWLKITGISIVIIVALVLLYSLVFNTSETEPDLKNDSFDTIIIDSVSTKKADVDSIIQLSEEKTDSITTASDTEVRYTTTTINKKFGGVTTTRSDIKKRAQTIRFHAQNDTTIRCKEGTVLKIEKGSFINPKTGQVVTGIVDLKVTEYYKLSDILLANLSTVSNGKQLETGGMLHIEATQNATDLKLKADKAIEISFPTQHIKDGMQSFSGEWKDENINWRLQNNQLRYETSVSIEEIEEDIDVPFNVVQVVPTFPGCKNEDDDIRKKCTIDAISKFIAKNFSTDIAYDLGLTGRQRINSVFKIDKEGNISFIRSRASDPRLSEEADRVIGLLPQMIPGMQNGIPVNVPYSLPIIFDVDRNTIQKSSLKTNNFIQLKFGQTMDTMSMSTAEQINSGIEMDTIYNNRRGMVEFIREVMHDNDFVVDSLFMMEWEQYKTQKLIRSIRLETKPYYIERAVILRKPLFEMDNTRFKTLEDDSITRGGHIIRVPWDETKIPTTTRIMNIIPKRKFYAGNTAVAAEEFESKLGGVDDLTISSRDASYYILKTSNLGWINCDRFINGRTKRIKYKLKIRNADGANISMVFKSLNSVLPSYYSNGVYDFQTVGANEDIVLVAIKRKDGKLYFDTLDTKTLENPEAEFNFKEVSLEELKKDIEQLQSTFNQ